MSYAIFVKLLSLFWKQGKLSKFRWLMKLIELRINTVQQSFENYYGGSSPSKTKNDLAIWLILNKDVATSSKLNVVNLREKIIRDNWKVKLKEIPIDILKVSKAMYSMWCMKILGVRKLSSQQSKSINVILCSMLISCTLWGWLTVLEMHKKV